MYQVCLFKLKRTKTPIEKHYTCLRWNRTCNGSPNDIHKTEMDLCPFKHSYLAIGDDFCLHKKNCCQRIYPLQKISHVMARSNPYTGRKLKREQQKNARENEVTICEQK